MLKKIAPALLLFCSVALAGCPAPSVSPGDLPPSASPAPRAPAKTITNDDKGKEVTVKLGQTFALELDANPSTAYSWFLLSGNEPWKLISRAYTPTPGSEQMTGAGGTERFVFQAEREGEGNLRLFYSTGFEEKIDPETLWQVKVKIEK
jgi:predicted secreted protein